MFEPDPLLTLAELGVRVPLRMVLQAVKENRWPPPCLWRYSGSPRWRESVVAKWRAGRQPGAAEEWLDGEPSLIA